MITSTKQSILDKRYLYTMSYYENLEHLGTNFSILIVRLNLFNHVLALFRAKFACNFS